MTVEQAWDLLIECGIATEYELQLVTDLVGYKLSVMSDVLYSRTGYTDLEVFAEDYKNGNY